MFTIAGSLTKSSKNCFFKLKRLCTTFQQQGEVDLKKECSAADESLLSH